MPAPLPTTEPDWDSLGVLYRGDRAPVAPVLKPEISVADIEREFALRP